MRAFFLCWLTPIAFAQTWVLQPAGTDASLRGIDVVDAGHAWASGTGGTCLYTGNGGKTWEAKTVPGASGLDFRGVQATGAASAVLMASGEGAQSVLYETTDAGATWKVFYANPDAKGFFDAIAFGGKQTGLLLGDPVDGMFALFRIDVADRSTARLRTPPVLTGEGAFAASNTSLVTRGKHVWFATGGKSGARVFRSGNAGRDWLAASTNMGGGDGAGIFSLAFRDEKNGIAVGGDYTKPRETVHNLAITSDGGATWTEPGDSKPRGYRSAVAWLPDRRIWIAVGPTGSELSRDDGLHWIAFDDGAFNAIGTGSNGVCYAVGPKGRIARLNFAATPAAAQINDGAQEAGPRPRRRE